MLQLQTMADLKNYLETESAGLETISSKQCIEKNELYESVTLSVDLKDGSHAQRHVIYHSGGAGIALVIDNKICLVNQYRVALAQHTLEIPAGRLNAGEAPRDCALRELREETGYAADDAEFIARAYSAPGFSSEKTEVFLAKNPRFVGEQALDEGEFVDVVWLDLELALAAVSAGHIIDGKTIIAILELARRKAEDGAA